MADLEMGATGEWSWEKHCEAAARHWESDSKGPGPSEAGPGEAAEVQWKPMDRAGREAERWRELASSPVAEIIVSEELTVSQRELVLSCASALWVTGILDAGLGRGGKQARAALRAESLGELLRSAIGNGSKPMAVFFPSGEPFSSTGPSGFARLAKAMRMGRLSTIAGALGPVGVGAAALGAKSLGVGMEVPMGAFDALVGCGLAAYAVSMAALTMKRTPDVAAGAKMLLAFEPRIGLARAKAYLRESAFDLDLGNGSGSEAILDGMSMAVESLLSSSGLPILLGSPLELDAEREACEGVVAHRESREIALAAGAGRGRAARAKSL